MNSKNATSARRSAALAALHSVEFRHRGVASSGAGRRTYCGGGGGGGGGCGDAVDGIPVGSDMLVPSPAWPLLASIGPVALEYGMLTFWPSWFGRYAGVSPAVSTRVGLP